MACGTLTFFLLTACSNSGESYNGEKLSQKLYFEQSNHMAVLAEDWIEQLEAENTEEEKDAETEENDKEEEEIEELKEDESESTSDEATDAESQQSESEETDSEEETTPASEEVPQTPAITETPVRDPYPASPTVYGEVGETIHHETGTYTIHKQRTKLGPYQSGPLSYQIDQIQLVSGEVTEPDLAGVAGDHVEFIQVDLVLQNTGGTTLQNTAHLLVLESGGHEFLPHSMFSGLGVGYDALEDSTPQRVSLLYMLDESISVTDIYSIYGVFSGARDHSGNQEGDSVRFNFSFSDG